MEELNKIQDEKITIKIQGKEREVKFNFSDWAKIEKEYNGMKNFSKVADDLEDKPFETLPHLLWIGLKDKDDLSEDTYLNEFNLSDIEKITEVFAKALYGALPEDEQKKVKVEAVKK